MEHCKEHEERTICIAKLKADNETNKENWAEGRKLMAARADRMDEEIDKKMNISTFYKVLGMLVFIMIAVIGAQGTLLLKINANVQSAVTEQAVVISKIENIEEHM